MGLLLEHFANVVPIELENIPTGEIADDPLLSPVDAMHGVWASKSTYAERSEARVAEAEVERPEQFFKAVGWPGSYPWR